MPSTIYFCNWVFARRANWDSRVWEATLWPFWSTRLGYANWPIMLKLYFRSKQREFTVCERDRFPIKQSIFFVSKDGSSFQLVVSATKEVELMQTEEFGDPKRVRTFGQYLGSSSGVGVWLEETIHLSIWGFMQPFHLQSEEKVPMIPIVKARVHLVPNRGPQAGEVTLSLLLLVSQQSPTTRFCFGVDLQII